MSSFTISYWNVLATGYPYSEDHGEPIFNGQTSVGLERIQKILKKLSDFMNEYPDIILCLQEVNNPIFKELLTFFNKKNYSYLYQNNDIYNDRSLGVMIAYPNKLEVKNVAFDIPQTFTKEIWVSDLPGKYTEAWNKITSGFVEFIKAPITLYEAYNKFESRLQHLHWRSTGKRSTKPMIAIKFETLSGEVFIIATSHLSCDYQFPEVMQMHAYSFAKFTQKLMKEWNCDNVIFGGDFNMKHEALDCITSGNWIQNSSSWYKFTNLEPMKIVTQSDWDEISCSRIKGNKSFIGNLDHCICSKQVLKNYSIVAKRHCGDSINLPNKDCPSDHPAIMMTFEKKVKRD